MILFHYGLLPNYFKFLPSNFEINHGRKALFLRYFKNESTVSNEMFVCVDRLQSKRFSSHRSKSVLRVLIILVSLSGIKVLFCAFIFSFYTYLLQ